MSFERSISFTSVSTIVKLNGAMTYSSKKYFLRWRVSE
jgi:hypothetical protein